MSKELAERIRASRRFTVEHGGQAFHCRRPTDFEAIKFDAEVSAHGVPVVAARYIESWSLTERALLGEGDDESLVAVTPELAAEWLADHALVALEIATRLAASYRERQKALTEAGKE